MEDRWSPSAPRAALTCSSVIKRTFHREIKKKEKEIKQPERCVCVCVRRKRVPLSRALSPAGVDGRRLMLRLRGLRLYESGKHAGLSRSEPIAALRGVYGAHAGDQSDRARFRAPPAPTNPPRPKQKQKHPLKKKKVYVTWHEWKVWVRKLDPEN